MATGTIENPNKGIRLIAQSTDASATWQSKMSAIKSAFTALSDSDKKKCFLQYSSRVLQIIDTNGKFSCPIYSTGNNIFQIIFMSLDDLKRISFAMSTSNTITLQDNTSETTQVILFLYMYI